MTKEYLFSEIKKNAELTWSHQGVYMISDIIFAILSVVTVILVIVFSGVIGVVALIIGGIFLLIFGILWLISPKFRDKHTEVKITYNNSEDEN